MENQDEFMNNYDQVQKDYNIILKSLSLRNIMINNNVITNYKKDIEGKLRKSFVQPMLSHELRSSLTLPREKPNKSLDLSDHSSQNIP